MTLSDYFLSTHGRIGRLEYWLGVLAMMAVTVIGDQMLSPGGYVTARPIDQPPPLSSTLIALVLLWPSTVISIKRFNDRDRPGWVGYLAGAVMALFVIANHAGYLLDMKGAVGLEKAAMLLAMGFFVWVIVDNGLMPGTPGPNRYGPDPLRR